MFGCCTGYVLLSGCIWVRRPVTISVFLICSIPLTITAFESVDEMVRKSRLSFSQYFLYSSYTFNRSSYAISHAILYLS